MALTLNHDRRLVVPIPMDSVSAVGRFSKYKKEEPTIIRQAEISGSSLDEIRRKREMLRCMTPEQAISVIEFHRNLTVFEALALAKKEGKLIVQNYVHDRILTEIDDHNCYIVSLTVKTGTIVIYTNPGKPFGEKIVYCGIKEDESFSISFDVPVRFRGKIDCALVVEHPDFDLIPLGKNAYELIADEGRLHLHERFPIESQGSYRYDEQYRLPIGDPIEDVSVKSRHIWRAKLDHIGLLARFVTERNRGRRVVDANDSWSLAYGWCILGDFE